MTNNYLNNNNIIKPGENVTGMGTAFKLRHIAGKRLTPTQAIVGKCADCMADYVDGRIDCNSPECPLYPWMPYGTKPRKKSNRGIGNKKVMEEKK